MDRRWAWCLIGVMGLACGAESDRSAPFLADEPDSTDTLKPPEYWAARLNSETPQVRREALVKLGAYGREAADFAPSVVALLADPDEKTGYTAAWALAHIGRTAHPLLIQALDSRNPEERVRAVYGIGETGPAGAELAERLRAMRDSDPSDDVRQMAVWAIRAVSGRTMVADPNMMLLEGVRGTRQERTDAVRRLGVTTTSSRVAIRELIGLLGDSIPEVRAQAVEALIDAGLPALPSLSAALSHRNRNVRQGALLVLSRLQRSF